MNIFFDFPVLVPVFSLIVNEILKVFSEIIKQKTFSLNFLFRSGGMPSGHSALSASLMVLAWKIKGLDSFEFALAVAFSAIVIYDAMNLRAQAGHHARILNEIQARLHLNERLGHSWIEVLAGVFVGGGVSFLVLS